MMKRDFNTIRIGIHFMILAVVTASLGAAYAKDANENRGQLSASDYKFAKKAACGGMTEVTLGKIAAERSSHPQVQQFGQRMVTDHGKAGQELKQIAASKGATLPEQPSRSEQKDIDWLSKLSGADFDQAYVSAMVRDHKKDVKEFKEASEDVKDSELKAFAAKTLTVIQDHLKMVEGLQSSLKHDLSENRVHRSGKSIVKD